jgi:pSer/pThr/pTyr-binding forkhead associated (FHA) protein
VGQAAELTEADFEQGAIMLGRSLNLAIPIPDEEVSRIHCSLKYEDGDFVLTDQSSTNGTLVNGEKLEAFKPYKLRHEDEIQLGHTYFIFSLAQPENSREPEHELARQLFQRFGWKVIQPKGARHWVVPEPKNLYEVDAASRHTIQQAFSSSAEIGLDLEAYVGKRAILEKFQVGRAGKNDHEAYVLFLNGRIIGAYAVDPESVSRLLPLSRYELSAAS